VYSPDYLFSRPLRQQLFCSGVCWAFGQNGGNGDGGRPPTNKVDQDGAAGGGISFIITNAQKVELKARGFTDEQIREMKPVEAHIILGSRPSSNKLSEEAKPTEPKPTKPKPEPEPAPKLTHDPPRLRLEPDYRGATYQGLYGDEPMNDTRFWRTQEPDEEPEDPNLPTVLATKVSLQNFFAYLPLHKFIFVPTLDLWPSASVNARIPPVDLFDESGRAVKNKKDEQVQISASTWLDKHKAVQQMTWAPGQETIVSGHIMTPGGWLEREGHQVFNLYRPPTLVPGDKDKAGPWLDHVRKVYPEDADHIIKWLAYRVQVPQDKINHALVLGGAQGIGKDTLLVPAKRAVGTWNCAEISPIQLVGRFNKFLRSVLLCVNEARNRGEFNRYEMYEHMKAYTASPPETLYVDEKNMGEYTILNCCGIIITTNTKDSLYLPSDDRRHYVAWSELTKGDFTEDYWTDLYNWYDDGGNKHVTAYLLSGADLNGWDPKAPPPKTQAFWEIVDLGRGPEVGAMLDALDALNNPEAVALAEIVSKAEPELAQWLSEPKNRPTIPHRMSSVGYEAVRSETTHGRWIINGKRTVVYAKAELSIRDRMVAAEAVVKRLTVPGSRSGPLGDVL
jgi:hypothetical protein